MNQSEYDGLVTLMIIDRLGPDFVFPQDAESAFDHCFSCRMSVDEAVEHLIDHWTKWAPSDLSDSIPMGSHDLEFQDADGEWHHFTVVATPTRIVFGGVCNTGFLESGFLERYEGESLEEGLQELLEDLQAYYGDGPDYVSRIVVNERM